MGVVEVGYSATFMDDPEGERPALKETKDTKIGKPAAKADLDIDKMTPEEIEAELARLEGGLKDEQFYVKHIPAEQFLCSSSDKPILEDNDWVGYWEDVAVEDIKKAGRQGVYKNTEKLQAQGWDSGDDDDIGSSNLRRRYEENRKAGNVDKVRVYKIWDLRTKTKIVYAEGHPHILLKTSFKRCGLKILRFDIDPYHFYPIPPIFQKLGPQDEYNASRDFLRRVRIGIVPRFTYDEDGIDTEELQKLEKGIMGTYVKRKAGTHNVIEPIQQPSFSENAIQTLTLSDKEFADVGGVGGDAQIAQTKTATQAKISEVKDQVQEGFDRQLVADWLAEIAEELIMLAIDNMLMEQWVAINIAPDSPAFGEEAQALQQEHRLITSSSLQQASTGIEFDLDVDIESLSPVTQEEKFQKFMQSISFIANPDTMKIFAVAPQLLKIALNYLGVRAANEQEGIFKALQMLMQIQMAQAQPPGPGVSPQPGGGQPGQPSASAQQGTAGGPQPGGPAGPGASTPQ
jgi:hypothetical protein